MKKKAAYQTEVINNYIDKETGEVLSTEKQKKLHSIVVNSNENFALMYSSLIGVLKELNGNDIFVLTYCSLHAEYGKNRISITKAICSDITEMFEIPYQSIRNSVGKLVKRDILIPQGSATYIVNPQYYWRGNSGDRINAYKEFVLKVTIAENENFDHEK